jgi:hypothetical protein
MCFDAKEKSMTGWRKNEKVQIKDEEHTDRPKIFFEDLPVHAQETIIDLIVSIIENKRCDSKKENK